MNTSLLVPLLCGSPLTTMVAPFLVPMVAIQNETAR